MLRKSFHTLEKFQFKHLFSFFAYKDDGNIYSKYSMENCAKDFEIKLNLDKEYLETSQQYIEPSTKQNLLHWLSDDKNHFETDILQTLSTNTNIYNMDCRNGTPIHIAFEQGNYTYLEFLSNKFKITKMPHDQRILTYLNYNKNNELSQRYRNIFFDDCFYSPHCEQSQQEPKFTIRDYLWAIKYTCPSSIHRKLSRKDYLEQLQNYIEPSSNDTLLHFILQEINFPHNRYSTSDIYLLNDIAKQISTTENIVQKNHDNMSPIHHAIFDSTIFDCSARVNHDFLQYLMKSNISIKKMPYDNTVFIYFQKQREPCVNYVEAFFDKDTYDKGVEEYRNRPITHF